MTGLLHTRTSNSSDWMYKLNVLIITSYFCLLFLDCLLYFLSLNILSSAWLFPLGSLFFDFSSWARLFKYTSISSRVCFNISISLLNSSFKFWIVLIIFLNHLFLLFWLTRGCLFSLRSFPLISVSCWFVSFLNFLKF